MGHPHYQPPRIAQRTDRAAEQAAARAFIARQTVQPRSHRRILRAQ